MYWKQVIVLMLLLLLLLLKNVNVVGVVKLNKQQKDDVCQKTRRTATTPLRLKM